MTSKVQISKGLLAGLVGLALAASFGVVFLLGRASAPSIPAAARAPEAAVPASGAASPAPITVPAWVSQPAVQAGAPAMPPVPRTDPARAAVAAYFKAVEGIQTAATGDPASVAQEIALGLGKGDSSGIDGMIRQAQDTRSRLAALAPPQPCAAYHKDLLASLDEGLDLMRAIKNLAASSDPAQQAPEITRRAGAMKARSDSLQSQEKALKRRYCD